MESSASFYNLIFKSTKMWFLSTSMNIDQELTFSYSAAKAESQARAAGGWEGGAWENGVFGEGQQKETDSP